MIRIPDTLVHLYRSPDGPFRSISDLSPARRDRVMASMSRDNTWHHARFLPDRREDYLSKRRRVEDRLNADFLAKGGRPMCRHPFYAILCTPGQARSLYPEAEIAVIPLAAIPPDQLSFTYIDSMVSYGLVLFRSEMAAFRHLALLPCHGKLYSLHELDGLIAEFGFPDGMYMEAQLWDHKAVAPYGKG